MATLESQDANILDAEAINWRLIVYPIVALLVIVLGGFSIAYYLQNQRDEHEAAARAAFVQAKTPEALLQVANEFPNTTHAAFALISAGDLAYTGKDYETAAKDYQRVISDTGADALLHDSAKLGLASTFEAEKKPDDAIKTYLEVARRGKDSPYAPFAYSSAARLYDQKNDKENERKILTETAALDPNSEFVKQAQAQLQSLNASAVSPILPSPATPAPTVAPNPVPTH
jgi:predicted negative regulator of RcsB-dependent stress response